MNWNWQWLRMKLIIAREIVIPAKKLLVKMGLAQESLLTHPDRMSIEEILLTLDDVEKYFGLAPRERRTTRP